MARTAYSYLMRHMDRHITIEELSDHLSVPQTTLKRNFRKVYGESIYAYLRKEKMSRAARMLVNTDHTILHIAGACGYTNASKFSAAFLKTMGMTPGEYRKRFSELS